MPENLTAGYVIIGILLPLASFAAGIYTSNRSIKKQDEDSIRKEVARDTEMKVRLDTIVEAVNKINQNLENMQDSITDIKSKYSVMDKEIEDHSRRLSALEDKVLKIMQDCKGACRHEAV